MVPAAQVVTQPKEDPRNYRVRCDKICNVLGFRPRYTVQDGVREMMDAFATGQITDYRDPRYNNSSFLRLNDRLRQILMDRGMDRDWVKLSTKEVRLLADVVVALEESQSQELMARLHKSLVQASLGNMDGFRKILTGIELGSSVRSRAASALDRQAVLAEPSLGV
jgi:hypothetical protein